MHALMFTHVPLKPLAVKPYNWNADTLFAVYRFQDWWDDRIQLWHWRSKLWSSLLVSSLDFQRHTNQLSFGLHFTLIMHSLISVTEQASSKMTQLLTENQEIHNRKLGIHLGGVSCLSGAGSLCWIYYFGSVELLYLLKMKQFNRKLLSSWLVNTDKCNVSHLQINTSEVPEFDWLDITHGIFATIKENERFCSLRIWSAFIKRFLYYAHSFCRLSSLLTVYFGCAISHWEQNVL